MTREEVLARWRERRDEWRRLGVSVDGAAICDEFLADLNGVESVAGQAPLNLQEAAAASGYSASYLGRLIRSGKLPNRGRPHAPKLYLSDLPQKPGLNLRRPSPQIAESNKGRIVRALLKPQEVA